MLDVFITIAVGLFLALFGLFVTALAVGERKTLSRSSKDHDALGKIVFVAWLLVGFWALTIIALCIAWSVWFAIVLLPSVLLALSISFGTMEEESSAVHETTDRPSELGKSEHAADAIGSHSTAATLPSSQLPGNANSEEHTQWLRGYDALERGKELYARKQPQQALEQFDQAIESSLTEADVYHFRGSCLQLLDFHFDAIDDFTEALATETDNCHLYFMRSVSRDATGDFCGEVADLHEAIRLADVPSHLNDAYDEYARVVHGGRNVEVYRMCLLLANMQLETQERDERTRKEHPDKSITDLAALNRAKCKRRPGRER